MDIPDERKVMKSESFQTCYEMASRSNPDGVSVPFLHINHLITNKKALNRPKDQLDIIQLEKIKKIRENTSPENP